VGTNLSVIVPFTACGRSTSSAVEGIRAELGRNFYKPESIDTRIGGKDTYWVFGGKPKGKRPLGRPRPRWEDNIKIDIEI
jgi:hypothetical protein